jgi:hypothetical protein
MRHRRRVLAVALLLPAAACTNLAGLHDVPLPDDASTGGDGMSSGDATSDSSMGADAPDGADGTTGDADASPGTEGGLDSATDADAGVDSSQESGVRPTTLYTSTEASDPPAFNPYGLVLDNHGNVYFADYSRNGVDGGGGVYRVGTDGGGFTPVSQTAERVKGVTLARDQYLVWYDLSSFGKIVSYPVDAGALVGPETAIANADPHGTWVVTGPGSSLQLFFAITHAASDGGCMGYLPTAIETTFLPSGGVATPVADSSIPGDCFVASFLTSPDLTALGSNVYWTSTQGVYSANVNSGVVNLEYPDVNGVLAITNDKVNLYWTATSGIWSGVPGNAATHLSTAGCADCTGIAADTKHVYWTANGNNVDGAGSINMMNLDGTNPVILAAATGPFRIAVDSSSKYVYWTEGGDGGGPTCGKPDAAVQYCGAVKRIAIP